MWAQHIDLSNQWGLHKNTSKTLKKCKWFIRWSVKINTQNPTLTGSMQLLLCTFMDLWQSWNCFLFSIINFLRVLRYRLHKIERMKKLLDKYLSWLCCCKHGEMFCDVQIKFCCCFFFESKLYCTVLLLLSPCDCCCCCRCCCAFLS